MDEIKVERNKCNGGYCATFKYRDGYCYADVAEIAFGITECMIFPCDDLEGHNVDFGVELYMVRGCPVTEEGLRRCIRDFLESNMT